MTTKWNLDADHSELDFKVRHMMIATVSGRFAKFNVQLETEGEDFMTAKAVVQVETASATYFQLVLLLAAACVSTKMSSSTFNIPSSLSA